MVHWPELQVMTPFVWEHLLQFDGQTMQENSINVSLISLHDILLFLKQKIIKFKLWSKIVKENTI